MSLNSRTAYNQSFKNFLSYKSFRFKNIIGIDLGTTNSCVAIANQQDIKVIANAEGERTTPSVVAFSQNDKLVGSSAKRQILTNPEHTFYATKRFIGKPYDKVKKFLSSVNYKIYEDQNGLACVKVDEKTYNPSEIAALILKKMRDTSEKHLNEKVEDAVITVPAYFDESQRQATKVAGKLAGLNILRIINEPTAAALAYGLINKLNEGKRVAVYDFGGGTFDICILVIKNDICEVKATCGDSLLGGEDFDLSIQNYLLKQMKNEYNIDLSNDIVALQRFREAAETAKKELSTTHQTTINLPFITTKDNKIIHFNTILTRDKLDDLTRSFAEATIEPCLKCINDSGFDKSEIDEVLLIGGMTRSPLIQKTAEKIFGKKPTISMNPDESVAIGAAIQAGIINGDYKNLLLLDVTPLSLGIETMGGVFTKLIDRNTTIPTSKKSTFSTAIDNQREVSIKIFQGERQMVKDNKYLGELTLKNIPPAPRGIPQIDITFEIDANGLLNVVAVDKSTKTTQKLKISNQSVLSDDEVNKIIAEAELNENSDKKIKEISDLKLLLETLISTAQKFLADSKDQFTKHELGLIEDAILSAKVAIKGDSIPNLRASKKILSEALWDIARTE